ncbi:hypothetical protein BaRGS_00018225 [Batillaria attramentaria]|uniref:Uncharacterized protein n=1 Tax=Batillaria attramentaria TaxID=370345 RepID=A0ABD0KTC3_9CAEN
MDINPYLYSVNLRQSDWADILKALADPQNQAGEAVLANVPLPVERNKLEVNYMSSEKGDGTVSLRSCLFKMVYSPGQVLQVQMSAEPRRGVLQPRADLLHTARNSCVCTQHVRDPVNSLTRHATRATREQQFKNYKDYVKAWMPLLEMEAALGAGGSDDVVIVENVPILIQPVQEGESNSKTNFTGSFNLNAKFCFDRCIEFGGKSPDSIREEKSSGTSHAFPLDYLCIRYRTECPGPVVSRVRESPIPEAVDRHYTWVGHAGVVAAKHKGRKEEDGGRLQVTFVLSSSSPPPPAELMTKKGDKATIEILPKSPVDRRAQQMLLSLNQEDCELAQAIAYGSKVPRLDKDRLRLGHKDENHEVHGVGLPQNNPPQLQAIKTALIHSVSLIQGPPGTGKTYTGIKLVYLFCKINRQLEAEGKGKKTVLFCGPSNKSVDLVARLLKERLGSECPKIVRMYGSAIESKDYPVPRGNLRSTRGMRDLKSDPALQDVTLHHIIRESGKPYAEKLAEFENFFQKCRLNPELYSVDSKGVKMYRKLLHKASVEELRNYEVVLTTCAVGGNRRLVEGTEGNIYQVMIDECAMSPEPHSLVPIIATKARQVVLIGDHKQLRPIITCQAAAELGLDQSLFERLYKMPSSKRVFLCTQYRMHPQICAFPSKEFYDGRLETGYSKLWSADPLPFWPTLPWADQKVLQQRVPHILVDVRGEEETLTVTTDEGNERSKSNALEAEKVIEIFSYLKKEQMVETAHIKVLTQYNAQRHEIEEKLKKLCGDRSQSVFDRYDVNKINVSTVVSSQGGEWDYVILSTVRSLPSYKIEPHPTHGWCRQNLGFITDKNQVNVALTRARKGLIIVGNKELLQCDDLWRHLVDRYEKLKCVREAEDFPPPPPARTNNGRRRGRMAASLDWQQM